MAVFFISDAHFGHDDRATEGLKLRKLDSLVDLVIAEGTELYILGDLFDFWFEYKYTIPKENLDVLLRLWKLAEAGVRLTYVTGNHDFWIGNLLSDRLGVDVHKDELSVSHEGKRILVTHGDGIAKSDRMYRILKRILRNRHGIFLYRQLPSDVGIPLAKWCSKVSRGRSSERPKETFLQDYRDFAKKKLSNGYDCVICGHTHHPEKVDFDRGIYINTGDWFEHFTYAVLREGRFELRRLDELGSGGTGRA